MFNFLKFFIIIKLSPIKIYNNKTNKKCVKTNFYLNLKNYFLFNNRLFNYSLYQTHINLFFLFKKNLKYWTIFRYMNFPSYSFQFNYKLHFLKKYKLISNFSIKIRFLLSLKYLLYLCGFFKDESPKIFFNFKKLNFLFFNYALMFTKFFEYFLPNQYFVIDYDKFDNKYYCKKKRSLKKNRLKKIKIFIRSTKEKYNDSIEA